MPSKMYVAIKGVIVHDGKLLLLRKKPFDQDTEFWDLPGGRMEVGESIEETLQREMTEELPSLKKFTQGNLLHVRKKPSKLPDGTELFLVYYAIETTDEEFMLSDEHSEYVWMKREKISKLPEPFNEIYLTVLDNYLQLA